MIGGQLLTRKDAQALYGWIIATYGDPTLEGTPRTVLSDTDYYQHRYDDGDGKPKPSRDNSGLRESTPRGPTIQSRGHPERVRGRLRSDGERSLR